MNRDLKFIPLSKRVMRYPLLDSIRERLKNSDRVSFEELSRSIGIDLNETQDLIRRNGKWLFVGHNEITGFVVATESNYTKLKKEVLDAAFEKGRLFKKMNFVLTNESIIGVKNEEIIANLSEIVTVQTDGQCHQYRVIKENQANLKRLSDLGIEFYNSVKDYTSLPEFDFFWADVGTSREAIDSERKNLIKMLDDCGLAHASRNGRYTFRFVELKRFIEYCGGELDEE